MLRNALSVTPVSDIDRALRSLLPQAIQDHLALLVSMDPAMDYSAAVRDRFVTSMSFSDVLVGIARSVEAQIMKQAALLPSFRYPRFEQLASPEPLAATELRKFIYEVRRVVTLADWWIDHRGTFVSAWSTLLGKANPAGRMAAK